MITPIHKPPRRGRRVSRCVWCVGASSMTLAMVGTRHSIRRLMVTYLSTADDVHGQILRPMLGLVAHGMLSLFKVMRKLTVTASATRKSGRRENRDVSEFRLTSALAVTSKIGDAIQERPNVPVFPARASAQPPASACKAHPRREAAAAKRSRGLGPRNPNADRANRACGDWYSHSPRHQRFRPDHSDTAPTRRPPTAWEHAR